MSEESKMRISLFICLSLVGSQVLSLESRDELFARLEACGEILGPLKRLGCFEQILEKENAAKATQLDKSSDAVSERLKVTVVDSQPELDGDKKRSSASLDEQSVKMEPERRKTKRNEFGSVRKDPETGFNFKIERVIKLSRGNYRLVFENGQVWEEIEYDPRTRYKVGDTVIVKRGVLGTYNIISEHSSRKNKVRRVK